MNCDDNLRYAIIQNESRAKQRSGYPPAGRLLCMRKRLRGRTSIATELKKIIDREGTGNLAEYYDIVTVDAETGNVVDYAAWPAWMP